MHTTGSPDWRESPFMYKHGRGERRSRSASFCMLRFWGFGHGPNFRPDTAARDPDVVDESFHQYAINWGIPRVGRLFTEQDLPLSLALNAVFPEEYGDVWLRRRRPQP